MLINSFGLTRNISAIWNRNTKLGWRRLQTQEFTIVKLLPGFLASHVCLIPLPVSTSFILLVGLSINTI